ncbi:MAG: leucine-rich repeat protein, partial [Clostridia bacterium]|nr:leucine-rich repeat protein [Clostridia bacterium]
LEVIGPYAYELSGITELSIPEGVSVIGYNAFRNCASLSKVIFNAENCECSNYSIFKDSGVSEIVFGENVTAIPAYVCCDADNLKTVVFSGEVTSVGAYAFRNSGVTAADLSNVTEIGAFAFENCKALENPNFGKELAVIGEKAYQNTNITEITIPESVTVIGDGAFGGCQYLTKARFNAKNCGYSGRNSMFKGSGLEEIEFGPSAEIIPAYLCYGLTSLNKVTVSGNALKEIGSRSFCNCSGLSSLSLPDSVQIVSSDAFAGSLVTMISIPSEDSFTAPALIDSEYRFTAGELGIKDTADRLLKRDAVEYGFAEASSNSSKYLYLNLRYEFKSSAVDSVGNIAVKIKLPVSVVFEADTVSLNGKKFTGSLSLSRNNTVTLSGGMPVKGTVSFKVLVDNTDYFASYAEIQYNHESDRKSEIIGIINSADELLTVSVPGETSKSTVTVKGVAPVGKTVSICVNDIPVKEVQTTKTGKYETEIELPVSADLETFAITASINGGERIARTQTVYTNSAVSITSADVLYRGRRYDMFNESLPVISWSNSAEFSFVIKVENKDEVIKMMIIANEKDFIECYYSEELDAFIGVGFKGVVPSRLRIQCVTTSNLKDIIGVLMNSPEAVGAVTPEGIDDVTGTVVK